MNRRLLGAVASVVLAASLAACGGDGQPEVTSSAPDDGVLRLSFLQDPGQPPDPDIYYSGQGLLLTQNTYEGLLQYRAGTTEPEIEAALATDWQVDEDNTVYTLTLREGVTFHDGTPFDSSAVKPSFDRRLAVDQGPAYMVADVASVETPSPTQVVITLAAPNSAFLDYLASPYGPKMMSPTILSEQAGDDFAQTYLQTHDAGTGPYTLTRADIGEHYELQAYEDWWGGDVHFDTIDLPVITDLSTQQLMLDNGELHAILHGLNAPAVEDYLGNDAVATYDLPSFITEQVYVNPNTGLLADAAARQAFQQALDLETLREQVFAGRSREATGNYPEGMLPEGTDTQAVEHDTAPLQEIGQSASAEDRTIVIGYDTSAPDDQQLANLISANLQQLGFTPEVQGYTTSQVFGWIGNQDGAPNVYVASYWPDAADPYTSAHILYAADGGLNYLGCSDPQIEELLPQALATGDDAVYARIGELASATGCWTNVAYRQDFMVAQTWLQGMEESKDIAAPTSLRLAGLSA
ncbi:ABC transporter substrate-binding protein [Blastococcus sp. SYSU D00669]